MMSKGSPGATSTGAARVPGGAIQVAKGSPDGPSSSAMVRQAAGRLIAGSPATASVPRPASAPEPEPLWQRVSSGVFAPAPAAGDIASTKTMDAPQSATMAAHCPAVTDVGMGAGTAPARRAPRNTRACGTAEAAQIATDAPGRTPSRCKAAATRSTPASSAARSRVVVPSLSAGAEGCSSARRRRL